MTFLPIVERELRVAARLTTTYKRRVLAGAAVAVISMAMLLVGGFSSSPSQYGGTMFRTLSYLLLAFCLLEGVRRTADCLSEERREGTLGLLFLTDLKGYDIILGKWAGASLPSVYGLLAMLPMLGLSLLLGGVTQGEFWRRSLALVNLLFFSLAAGVWVSSRSRLHRRAVAGTVWLMLICLGAPLLTNVRPMARLSPVYAFLHAPELAFRGDADGYWESIVVTQMLGWVMLGWAALVVSAKGLDGEEIMAGGGGWRERWGRWLAGSAAYRVNERRRMLGINPAFWLAGRERAHRVFVWVFIAVGGGICLLCPLVLGWSSVPEALILPLVINYLVKMRLGAQACHCLATARANNALEMLLCTPLKIERIVQGQILALKRMFQPPVMLLLVAETIGGFGALVAHAGARMDFGSAILAFMVIGGILAALFGLDVLALTWTGMWFGLSSKNETQAVFKTILYVLVLPLFFCLFYCFGIPFLIAWPIVCSVMAREKLHSEFRKLAGQRFVVTKETGWLPVATAPLTPPRLWMEGAEVAKDQFPRPRE